MNYIFTAPYPVRWRASSGGDRVLVNGTRDSYPGTNARDGRALLLVTNKDAAKTIQILTTAGIELDTIWPQATKCIPISDDVYISNTSGTDVHYVCSEAFFTQSPSQQFAGTARAGTGGGGGAAGGGAGGPGGGSGAGQPGPGGGSSNTYLA
jgi:hypothetical protein